MIPALIFSDRGFCVAVCGTQTECPILSGGIAAVSVFGTHNRRQKKFFQTFVKVREIWYNI